MRGDHPAQLGAGLDRLALDRHDPIHLLDPALEARPAGGGDRVDRVVAQHDEARKGAVDRSCRQQEGDQRQEQQGCGGGPEGDGVDAIEFH
ncbi:hypothetical protein D3C86_1706000 [compost metagenome]